MPSANQHLMCVLNAEPRTKCSLNTSKYFSIIKATNSKDCAVLVEVWTLSAL